jgi:hypothetical protein
MRLAPAERAPDVREQAHQLETQTCIWVGRSAPSGSSRRSTRCGWSGPCSRSKDDKWQIADRRYFSIGSMAKVNGLEGGEDPRSYSLRSREERGWR